MQAISALIVRTAILLLFPLLVAAQPQRENTLTRITDQLYRGSNGVWHSLVYVTDAGILLVDTLNPDYAAWLKRTLAERFPDRDVKYVIYSHSHFDHAEGGKVFADTATFIAHSAMLVNMDGRYPHMPGDMIDRNQNGTFEPEEFRIPWDAAPGVCGGFYPQNRDIDQDGHLTPAEYFAEVVPPDQVFDTSMTLSFGGQDILLLHPGRNHADDMLVVLFPDQQLLFSADFIADALVRDSLLSLPSACGPFDGHPLQEWIASYRAVEALDFTLLTTGHGTPLTFSKADLSATREYFEYLLQAVSTALAAGLTLEEMKVTLLLEPYRNWAQYERLREQNIEAAWQNLTAAKP
jgi:glyoxylase-like metal-dependent hydrolase (beta-lactamase superfamily II)